MVLKRWATTIVSGTVDVDIELIEAQATEETVIFSLLISNTGIETATIDVTHTDTDGSTPIFGWRLVKEVNESPTSIDSPIVLEAGDKLLFRSDVANVAILANGEAK